MVLGPNIFDNYGIILFKKECKKKEKKKIPIYPTYFFLTSCHGVTLNVSELFIFV